MSNTSLEPELNSLKSKLVVEIESDSKQLEFLKKRIEKNQALLSAVRSSLGATTSGVNGAVYGAKSEIIQNAIKCLQQQFTQDDVETAIRQSNPEMEINRNRIRASLWILCTKFKKIKVFRKGNSRVPAIYEKMGAPPPLIQVSESAFAVIAPKTIELFEDSVRMKSGRIGDLAKRLGIKESVLSKLVAPASRVYIGERGWLKLKE